MSHGFTTRILHTPFARLDAHNSLHMPVYEGVSYDFESAEEMELVFSGAKAGHIYSRTSNPTVEHFERKMARATNALWCMAFSSGMAAVTNAVLSIVRSGDNVVVSSRLFGHTYAFFAQTLPGMGIETRFCNTLNIQEVKQQIDKNTRLLFLETITNPQLEIADLQGLSKICRKQGIVLIADSTMTPPNVFQSKQWGVDLEVLSATKFLSGGAAAFGGVLVDNGLYDWSQTPALSPWMAKGKEWALWLRLRREIFRHLGGSMTAQVAHILNLGLETLDLRVKQCVANCLELVKAMEQEPRIKHVCYPGAPNHMGYALALQQFNGMPGAVLSFDLESQSDCYRFFNALKVIRRATNLNDNKTLIIHPYSTIYSEFSPEQKAQMGIRNTMFRLSVGIEESADLIEDIRQALQTIDQC